MQGGELISTRHLAIFHSTRHLRHIPDTSRECAQLLLLSFFLASCMYLGLSRVCPSPSLEIAPSLFPAYVCRVCMYPSSPSIDRPPANPLARRTLDLDHGPTDRCTFQCQCRYSHLTSWLAKLTCVAVSGVDVAQTDRQTGPGWMFYTWSRACLALSLSTPLYNTCMYLLRIKV
ncbi:hypothetical protein DFP73DRAFT_551639, partial [Morchella snyderi]